MILIDTSAWVEYLRATGSAPDRRVRQLIAEGAPLLTTDIVHMELAAGARDEAHAEKLRRLLLRFHYEPVLGLQDYEAAATAYRLGRRRGLTVRKLTDCLIAIVAIRTGAELLHADRDFDTLASFLPLSICSHGSPATPT